MTTKKAQKYVVTIRYSNGVRSIAPSVRNAPLTFPTLAAAKEHAAHYTPVYEAKVEKAPAKKPGPKPKSLRDVINKQRQAVEAARRKKITQYKKNILQQLGLVKGSIQWLSDIVESENFYEGFETFKPSQHLNADERELLRKGAEAVEDEARFVVKAASRISFYLKEWENTL